MTERSGGLPCGDHVTPRSWRGPLLLGAVLAVALLAPPTESAPIDDPDELPPIYVAGAGCPFEVIAPADRALSGGVLSGRYESGFPYDEYPDVVDNVLRLFDDLSAGESAQAFIPEGVFAFTARTDRGAVIARDEIVCVDGTAVTITLTQADVPTTPLVVFNGTSVDLTRLRVFERLDVAAGSTDLIKGSSIPAGTPGAFGPEGLPRAGYAVADADDGRQWVFAYDTVSDLRSNVAAMDWNASDGPFCEVVVTNHLGEDVELTDVESTSGWRTYLHSRVVPRQQPGEGRTVLVQSGYFGLVWHRAAGGPPHKTLPRLCDQGTSVDISLDPTP
jgi:hypothetical protein